MNKQLLINSFQQLLLNIKEGVHIVDKQGVTQLYNKAMAQIEGTDISQITGKHILEAYLGWSEENSTLLTALKTGQTISRTHQKYKNLKGETIATVNLTMPIFEESNIIGAIEISQNVTDVNNLSEEVIKLRQQILKPKKKKTIKKHYTFDMLIGHHPKYTNAIKVAKRAAKSSSSVIIYGETGTGKELFSQSIHYESDRRDSPFLAINCAALPETLLESILFGTVKGSFTGAEDRPGLFEQADSGTLFLDEINSMSPNLQAKILRALQEGYIRRVGAIEDILVDVRIIASTNVLPEYLIENGELRKDLYYRINVLSIHIPSLKERPEDIKYLTEHFLKEYSERLNKNVWLIAEDVMKMLENYEWKGNVRELQNFIESCLNMVQDDHMISSEHMPLHWQEAFNKVVKEDESFITSDNLYTPLNQQIANLEKKLITEQLKLSRYNVSKAANALGLSRQNLQYKLKKYHLE